MPSRRTEMPRPAKPLARRTPLKAVKALVSRTRLRQVSPRRAAALQAAGKPVTARIPSPRKPAVPASVRAVLIRRSGKWCELMLPGCYGHGTDTSHRKATKAGGRRGQAKVAHDVASNAMWACRHCHSTLHRYPAWAKAPERGYALDEGQNPATTPVLYRRKHLVLLDNAGGITPCRGAA